MKQSWIVKKLWSEWTLLVILVIVATVLRLYKLHNPIADWHSFRQADTASVTREFVRYGINLLRPTYHDLSNIQSGKDNPQGYRMVEFPLVNAVTAQLITTFGLQKEEDVTGRLVSVTYSLVTLVALYLLVRELSGKTAAFFAAGAFTILPFAVYYSRVILPEPAVLASLTTALASTVYWRKTRHPALFLIMVMSFAESLLLKPYGLFILPVFAFLVWEKWRFGMIKMWETYVFPVSIVPLIVWRWWILKFPEGVPASDWLFNKENIRFTGAFFHWIFEVRIAMLILGIGLLVPFVFGLMKKGKDQFTYVLWALCMLAYVSVLAGGNVQHDYYQVLLLPMLCAVVGRGFSGLLELVPKTVSRYGMALAVGGLSVFSVFVSWYTIRGYYNVNHWEIVEAGNVANRILPKNAKVIAPYMGDTAFLYQTKRTGWPIGFEIDDKIAKGAQYYISVNYDDETNALMKKYKVLEKTPKYVIIQLR